MAGRAARARRSGIRGFPSPERRSIVIPALEEVGVAHRCEHSQSEGDGKRLGIANATALPLRARDACALPRCCVTRRRPRPAAQPVLIHAVEDPYAPYQYPVPRSDPWTDS